MAFNLAEAAQTQMHGDAVPGIAAIAEHLRRSSVQIGDERGVRGGSGVIWETGAGQSVIITNAHVVSGRRARVTLHNGQTSEGRVINRDDRRDLAALTIDAGGLPAATIGDSSALRVGELVFAVGNPLGLVGALTVGIVHANGKQWIGADVRLAPGNSGGMLADAEGRVVGINSMIAHGLALAIPSNAVKRFLARESRPQLGIKLRAVPVTHDAEDLLGLLVFDVQRGSLAERSGLMIGDIIVGTSDYLFNDLQDLTSTLEDAAVSRRGALEFSLIRGGKKIHWPVTFQTDRTAVEAR